MRCFNTALAGLTLLATAAAAQTPPPPNQGPPLQNLPKPGGGKFDAANTTHDGKLTREQAEAGFPMVARNFDTIDKDHKGYITKQDIREWHVAHKPAPQPGAPPMAPPQ